jgi:hypothetical protein
MIPHLRPERILSRTIFEITLSPQQSTREIFHEVCKEIVRLLPPIISVNLIGATRNNNNNNNHLLDAIFCLVSSPQKSSTKQLLEIKDSRIAAFLCDILEERRVMRLTSGGGNIQLSWWAGEENINSNDQPPLYVLPDANDRVAEELRMNVDEELWNLAQDRRQDVAKWLNLYAPQQQQQDNLSLERLETAFQNAASTLFSSSSQAQGVLSKDPFQQGFFVGAFDKQGRPTIISSLLPVLFLEIKPSARQIANTIAKTKNVYLRCLCMLYLRYICTPENIINFFANIPRQFASENALIKSQAPSVFALLGKVFEDDNSNSPLLDYALIQTSTDGSSTTTMKAFSRSLLKEDELVELWLPTYSKFAVEHLTKIIDAVDQEQINLRQSHQMQQHQQHHHHNAVRRERDLPVNNNTKNQDKQKPSNSANANNEGTTAKSLLLPTGIKNISQFAALLGAQAKQMKEEEEAAKQKQLDEERLLREKIAGTADEQLQRREMFQRQANALKDRRKRDVLERLKTTADAKARIDAATGGLHQGDALLSTSAMTTDSSTVVDPSLIARSIAFFGSTPPAFATLPPFYSTESSIQTATSVGGGSNNRSSALMNFCSTTTVGNDEMFVCF